MVEILAESYTEMQHVVSKIESSVMGIHLDSLSYSKYGVDKLVLRAKQYLLRLPIERVSGHHETGRSKIGGKKKALIDTTLAKPKNDKTVLKLTAKLDSTKRFPPQGSSGLIF